MFFFFKQKTAYEMRISDWSSDVCSSDLLQPAHNDRAAMNPLSPHHLVKYLAERILAVEAYLERGGRAPEFVGRPIDDRHDLEQQTFLHRSFEWRISPGRRARWPPSVNEYGDSRRPPHPQESSRRS